MEERNRTELIGKLRSTASEWRGIVSSQPTYDRPTIEEAVRRWAELLGFGFRVRFCDRISIPLVRSALFRRLRRKGPLEHFVLQARRVGRKLTRMSGLSHELTLALGPLFTVVQALNYSLAGRASAEFVESWPYLARLGIVFRRRFRYGSVAWFCALDCLCHIWSDSRSRQNSLGFAERMMMDCLVESLPSLREAVGLGAGWIAEWGNTLVVIPRPHVTLDAVGDLHSEGSPSVVWIDGIREYHWHGWIVSRRVLVQPGTLTAEQIREVPDLAKRRSLIESYGLETLVRDSHSLKFELDADLEKGQSLMSIDFPGDESVVVLIVTCPSTGREHVIRVPPYMGNCRDAVAWTFGMAPGDYQPLVET